MYLPSAEEWGQGSRKVKGVDVYHAGSGGVRDEWLSSCRDQRALTREMMSSITDLSNLLASAKRVISNKGVAGIDGMEVGCLGLWLQVHQNRLIDSLQNNTYRVSKVKGVQIPKPKGGYRQLGIPVVIDRMVQQAIQQILEQHYDPTFSEYSYGFRKGKGSHACLSQASEYVRSGYRHIVDIDLAGFFDEVNHDRLLWQLRQRIGDPVVIALIGKFLRSGLLQGGLTCQRTKGTPQGSPLSPLLSNIVLDELDKELERRGLRFVRYADDLIIFTSSRKAAERVESSITNFLENRLKLKVNAAKSGIRRPTELNFLGHGILTNGDLSLSKESYQRLQYRLKSKTQRNRGISLARMVEEVNVLMRGWLHYFRQAKMKVKLAKLMSWLRRRLRCFRLKQGKRTIGVARLLKGLGVPEWRSWLLALSSKGWYAKSCSPPSHEGMNLSWFTKIGLFDLSANYCSQLMKPPST